jgi:hypothetical protein
MDDLLTESLVAARTFEIADPACSVEERLRIFLERVRENIRTPINFTVYLTVLASEKGKAEPSPDAQVYDFTKNATALFQQTVAPLTSDQYATLIGPIVFQELFTPVPASDKLLDELVVLGLGMIAELPAHV